MSTIPTRFRGKAGRDLLVQMLRSQKIVSQENSIARDLAAIATPMMFEAAKGKSTIIFEGDSTTDIYFILSGEASIRIKRREVAIRYPDDHVGEMALIDPNHMRSASVIATKRTEVARVSRQDFLKLTNTYRRFGSACALNSETDFASVATPSSNQTRYRSCLSDHRPSKSP
jgi:CRP/FNR family cyclic AMP-dependent transcriptional regulator